MANEWYYAVEGASIGPISQTEFDSLVRGGTIRADTLVWQEGMEDWLPHSRAGVSSGPDELAAPAQAYGKDDPAREDANTFTGALKDGFARYVDFGTRSTRPQYWWWTLWMVLISFGASLLDITLGLGELGPLNSLVSLATLLPSIAVGIRRLHDIGRAGWWLLIVLVPVVGWIVLIVFLCTKTQVEQNQWGPKPRQ